MSREVLLPAEALIAAGAEQVDVIVMLGDVAHKLRPLLVLGFIVTVLPLQQGGVMIERMGED